MDIKAELMSLVGCTYHDKSVYTEAWTSLLQQIADEYLTEVEDHTPELHKESTKVLNDFIIYLQNR